MNYLHTSGVTTQSGGDIDFVCSGSGSPPPQATRNRQMMSVFMLTTLGDISAKEGRVYPWL